MSLKTIDLMENFLLLENKKRLDFLKDKHKDGFDTSHDTLAKHQESDKIVDHFAKKADPSSTKEHTQWLLDQYKKQHIRQEDAPQIKRDLKDFEKTKPHLEKKDLNQYKHISDVRDAVASKLQVAKKQEHEKKKAAENKKEDLKELYNEDGITGYKIPNRESSIRNYGASGEKAKTNWCTAANSSQNMFNHYKGGKYTMHFPNGHVLQFHHQSRQIMDERDRPVQDDDPRYEPHMHHINKFIEQTHKLEKEPSENLVGAYKKYTPEEVDEHMNKLTNPEAGKAFWENAHDRISKKHEISDKHFDTMHKAWHEAKKNDSSSWYSPENKFMNNYIGENGNLKLEHAKKILAGDEHHEALKRLLVGNSKRSPELLHHHIDNMEKYKEAAPYENHTASLLDSKHLNDDHISKMIKDHSDHDNESWEKAMGGGYAGNAKQISPQNQNALLEKGNGNTMAHLFLRHQNDASPKAVDHVTKDLVDEDGVVDSDKVKSLSMHMKKKESINSYQPHHYGRIAEAMGKIAEHHPDDAADIAFHVMHANTDASNQHAESVKNAFLNNAHKNQKSYAYEGLTKLLKSNRMTKEDLEHAWTNSANKPTGAIRTGLAHNPKIGDEKINQLIDDHGREPSYGLRSALLANPKVKGEHLERLYSMHADHDHLNDIANHHAIKHENMNRMFDNLSSHDQATHILNHPKATETMQHKAAEKPHMHGILSSSPYAMPSILDKLAKSPIPYVRKNVANHKNASIDTLKRLVKDDNPEVAEAALKKVK